jgi:enediyne biosynthesis protein E4
VASNCRRDMGTGRSKPFQFELRPPRHDATRRGERWSVRPPQWSWSTPCRARVWQVMVVLVFGVGAMRGAPALDWAEGTGVRTLEVAQGARESRAGFSALDSEVSGVRFTNVLSGDLSLTNAVAHNGAGVAIGDVDGDGWPDLYFCALQGPNRLYRNLGGMRFEEMPLGDAACANQLSTGAAFADVDGDGDLDLLVNGIGVGTRLFLNDGLGSWTEMRDTGLSRSASATSMALADIDGDGDLDLYVTHYIDVMHLADPTTRFAVARDGGQWRVTKVNGEPASRPYWKDRFEVLPGGRVRELPESDALYRNDGAGRFTAIQSEPGVFLDADGSPVGPYRDWGLSVMFRDLNGDGAPDLYVCNDNASPDRVWFNDGMGRFRAAGPYMFRHSTRSSMALDFADVDRDGHDDLLVLDMLARSHGRRMRQLVRDYPDLADNERVEEAPRYNRNMLYFGRADGSFAEAALMAGVAATDWSWCPIFLDVDLDGYEDLLVANGFEFDVMDQDSMDRIRTMKLTFEQRKRFRQFHPAWPTANVAFRNRRDGTFEVMSQEWGFDLAGVSCGMAVGDLDNDGDLDVVVNNLNAVASIYRNDASAGRIAVRLRGRAPNTSGIGARLRLVGGAVVQTQEMMSGGRYMSCDQAMRVFAAERASDSKLQLEVTWRNGDRTTVAVQPDTVCEVIQADVDTREQTVENQFEAPPWFKDVSALLNHEHLEDDFDDWSVQPLLPRRLSRLGPGVGWFDANGDGWDDLIVSAAAGGRLALYLNEKGQSFRSITSATPIQSDQGAVVGWADGSGKRRLLVAHSNFGVERAAASELRDYSLDDLGGSTALTDGVGVTLGEASPGPLALADVDGDGDLDLFVGGRFRPGRYPEAVSSAIWLNENGQWRHSPELSAPFESLGLVSGASFGDLDGDGVMDLALAVEWGPVRLFVNRAGRFEEKTQAWGFADKRGWWTGVTMGDFDGDGRLDLAVGNWGRNSIYELNLPGALRIYYEAEAEGDIVRLIEAWRDGQDWFPVRTRPWLARGFPELPQRIGTHEAYGQSTVTAIWGSRDTPLRNVEANYFESAVFLNRGTSFECLPLPREAQRAPVFAVTAGDFDGDGIEDLFLSQNFFGGGSDLTREDGGRGLWLRGVGDGTFAAVESGVRIQGEQRGAALADFDRDGRVDLVVAQNNGSTMLYRNERGRRGLRVVLRGPAENPDGVGAQVRLRHADGSRGPVRNIQAGSGYWSQDSPVAVLGMSESALALEIRWPGGHEQMVRLARGQWEVEARYDAASK